MKPRQIAVLLALGGLGAMLLYVTATPRRNAKQTSSCQSNLKLIGLGMMQYARDYDEHFPLKANWPDALVPYAIGNRYVQPKRNYETLFRCPTSNSYYAFNSYFSALNLAIDRTPAQSPLNFDVSAGHNAPNLSDNGSLWPTSPVHAWAKKSGNNVLFADGHVKLMNAKPVFKSFAPKPTPKPKAAATRKGKR